MIRFFNLNYPRLLVIFLFLLATRAAAVLLENPFTYIRHESETLGEFINRSGLSIEDLGDTNAGSLYALFYGLITYLSHDSTLISALLSALFVFVQAFLINTILIRLAVFRGNSYVPAIVYTLLMSSSPEFMMLSPEMVSVTFVLIGLRFLLTHLKYGGTEEDIISTGFSFGLAGLFAKPAFFLLPLMLLLYLLYSNTLIRRYVLASFGFALPFAMLWLYYFWNDAGTGFWTNYLDQLVHRESKGLVAQRELLTWAALPILLSLLPLAQYFTGSEMTNHQIQIQHTMFWLGLFGMFFHFISANGSFSEFIWIIPSATYFISLFLHGTQKSMLAEVILQTLLWAGLYLAFAPMVNEGLLPLSLGGLVLSGG